ncbi:cephalosporin hydroxylase family protein [Chenggangzhangella methanolivorans]|uniref:Cephalosporin hydroxylase family protein n=1 Tax=Chenggangzhangella methanolivorans TaxID=1437009 RepID=A0A9E6UIR7_9HYPH|nr:cephalosporin hydroxylase family protein [Chenggangzhangella methanolivorans]QZO01173.1 cephalosporin hydroxylase family protein [Chenggangzhangella methanolivorans]
MTVTIIDEGAGTVTVREADGAERVLEIADAAAFDAASKAWLRVGWDTKHVYSFTWLGRPIIQLPEDMIRLQEVIFNLKPDVIVETGIAHGGSLIYYASLFEMLGKGRVIGVDIEIRPHNRSAIEEHPMSKRIEMIEGSSIAPETVAEVSRRIKPDETVLVILDSNHLHGHVLEELRAYGPLVSVGSYVVATDGIMEQVVGAPRSTPDWTWNNPKKAANDFVAENPDFVIEEPSWLFNESVLTNRITYWPDAFVKRVR